MRILIRGGTVVTATGSSAADVLIDGETVVALLDPAHTGSFAGLADRSIDATGKYVVPGGIDVHTHLDMPFGGTFSADDKDEVVVRDLDMGLLAEVRDLWQFYRDRRPDAYGPLVQP